MKLSIIIVTYNSLNLIFNCLKSILQYNDIGNDLEIIVVDNNSEEGELMFNQIKKQYNNITCIKSNKNGGYGYGNNIGIKTASGDLVVVMNPDVRLVSPIFKKIIHEFQDPTLGMVGVEFIDGSNPYYFKPEYNSLFHNLFIHAYIKRRKYDSKKMFMSGSFMIFDKNIFIEAGMYDENIFMYCEEADITNRILNIGKKVKWLKGIMVKHLAHGRNFNQKQNDIRYISLDYYCNKYNIDSKRLYNIRKIVLQVQLLGAKILRDSYHIELFTKMLKSLKLHIKSL